MELNKNDTKVLKGIAIIGMMMLHFWAHPEWVNDELWWNSIIPETIYIRLGNFGNVCVSLFAFITGYSFFANAGKWNDAGYRVKKLFGFLKVYWIYELIFLATGYFTGNKLPSFKILLLNLFGFETSIASYVCVPFAWYVSFYITTLLLYPLICKLMNIEKWNVLFVLLTYVLCQYLASEVTGVLGISSWLKREGVVCTVMIGYLFAKYQIFTKLCTKKSYLLGG